MVEKVVSASAGMSTIVVGGDVVKVTFEGHSVNYVFIRHVSGEILVSRSPNVADSVDGTVKLSAGGYRFDVSAPVIYISGSGVCEVSASTLGDFPFKVSGKGGEIPDLSAYAKKTDVPNIKVNAAVDADTVGGFTPYQFLLGAASVQLTTSINEYYTAGTLSVEEQYTPDFPVGYGSFGLLDVRTYGSIVYQTIRFENGKIIHRARVLGATDWTEWAEIYTSGNKPYVTGTATVAANSTTCITNHGFKPSAVIYWYGIEGGVAVSSNETQFMLSGVSQNADRLVNYLIFK